jgi:hypothetical protein
LTRARIDVHLGEIPLGFSHQEAAQEDAQAQAQEDAEEDQVGTPRQIAPREIARALFQFMVK